MLTPQDLSLLPEDPGVYRFYDQQKNLLYIGKAKSLRKRVKSYFSISIKHKKTRRLVSQIAFIEYTLTIDEKAALILENNLIQILSPQFNILVRKEASFPVIEISQDKFAQIKLIKFSKAKGNIYGPYSSKNNAILKINFIKKVFKLKTCEESQFRNRTSPCFQYQIKECSAPCVDKITLEKYNKNLKAAIFFLKGEYSKLHKILTKEMLADAKDCLFEEAVIKRDALISIENLNKNKLIVDFNAENFDIILLNQTEENLFIYLVIVRAGVLVGDTYYISKPPKDMNLFLIDYIKQKYLNNFSISHIYINSLLDQQLKTRIDKMGIEILSTQDVKNPAFNELNNRANNNFSQLIENYSFQNLYLGGISSLKERFNLSDKINIEYLDLRDKNFSVFIPNEDIEKICISKISQSELKDHLLAQNRNINPYLLFIKIELDKEKKLLEILLSLNLDFIILLIKPIAYGKDVIIQLRKSCSYNMESVIMHSGIQKLVALLENIC